jgi:hypothetical protein
VVVVDDAKPESLIFVEPCQADCKIVKGVTADSWPHCGKVPGKENHFILAGFNGAGMPHIYLTAKGIANMIRNDVPFEQSGIPSIFKTSYERLNEDVVGE